MKLSGIVFPLQNLNVEKRGPESGDAVPLGAGRSRSASRPPASLTGRDGADGAALPKWTLDAPAIKLHCKNDGRYSNLQAGRSILELKDTNVVSAEERTASAFLNRVHGGEHPKTAAESLGGLNYEVIKGMKNSQESTHSVRLNREDRLSFKQNNKERTMYDIQISKHYKGVRHLPWGKIS